jgi:hypothetical protein
VTDPLCQFSRRFPDLAASILHRDRHKRRNFREETITDILMAGLTAFEPFGVRVDFPADESKTGDDMDWEFVAPRATNGRRYLRLHIQAKRAIFKQRTRKPSYWLYEQLDHEAQMHAGYGSQAKRLIDSARAQSGCVPLYIFYHTLDGLQPSGSGLPAIEGVNAIFADLLGPLLTANPPARGNRGWSVDDKKVEKWRPHFMPLSDLLCFGGIAAFPVSSDDGRVAFLVPWMNGLFSPGMLADRLNVRKRRSIAETELVDTATIEAVEQIPQATLRAIETPGGGRRRAEIERPRAIFLSGDGG